MKTPLQSSVAAFNPPLPNYRNDPNPRFVGNRLIEALPDVPSKAEAYEALALQPQRPKDFRSLPRHRKLDMLGELQQLFVPTEQHILALQRVIATMRECYAYRDFNRPEVQASLYRASQGHPIGITRLSPTGGGSNGTVLWGVTGSGKTSFLDRLVAYIYSQFVAGRDIATGPIYHRLVQGRPAMWPQLPVVRIQCQNTLTGTIDALLAKIDSELGTSYSFSVNSRTRRDKYVIKVQQILTIHFVGLLIVEDVHKLNDSNAVILEYFCDLMEEAGFPILLVATYRFRRSLDADLAIASKLTAKGKMDFAPLPLLDSDAASAKEGEDEEEDEDEDVWTPLVEELWNLNLFTVPMEMPADFPKWLHFHTMGVRRIARVMMTALFERSLDDNLIVNLDLLDQIASVELLEYQESLWALRRRSVGAFLDDDAAAFEHLMLPLDADIALNASLELRDSTDREKKAQARAEKKQSKVKKGKAEVATKSTAKPGTPEAALIGSVDNDAKKEDEGTAPKPARVRTRKGKPAIPLTSEQAYELFKQHRAGRKD
jgi:hypothetical protein